MAIEWHFAPRLANHSEITEIPDKLIPLDFDIRDTPVGRIPYFLQKLLDLPAIPFNNQFDAAVAKIFDCSSYLVISRHLLGIKSKTDALHMP